MDERRAHVQGACKEPRQRREQRLQEVTGNVSRGRGLRRRLRLDRHLLHRQTEQYGAFGVHNSMFAWYKKAKVCLAYLEDVSTGPDLEESFRKSVWFTRAWTLQELIAPRSLEFFDHSWTGFGSKKDRLQILEDITGVTKNVLGGSSSTTFRCSVAERMSWASTRHATRPEDVAYSLMGIFAVNMPLLYGEGIQAFQRLQQEIMRNSADTTFLCREFDNDSPYGISHLLALSPAEFSRSRKVLCHDVRQIGRTNIGLKLPFAAVRWDVSTWGLLVGSDWYTPDYFIILVRRTLQTNTYYKEGLTKVDTDQRWIEERKFHVQWNLSDPTQITDSPAHGFFIRLEAGVQIEPVKCTGKDSFWVAHKELGDADCASGIIWSLGDATLPSTAIAICRVGDGNMFSIQLAFDFDGYPCCLVCPSDLSSQWDVCHVAKHIPLRGTIYGMTPIHNESGRSWFLRCRLDQDVTTARIATEITGDNTSASVSLFSHSFWKDDQRWWTFTISRYQGTVTEVSDIVDAGLDGREARYLQNSSFP